MEHTHRPGPARLEITRAASGKSELLDRDLAQMLTPQLPDGNYGLGAEINNFTGHRRFGHTGGGVGYNCFSFAWPDAGAAVAVMTNSEDAREVLASVLAAAERRYANGVKAAPPGDVTGRYLLRDDYPIDIAAADGRLTLIAAGQPPAVLLPLSGGPLPASGTRPGNHVPTNRRPALHHGTTAGGHRTDRNASGQPADRTAIATHARPCQARRHPPKSARAITTEQPGTTSTGAEPEISHRRPRPRRHRGPVL